MIDIARILLVSIHLAANALASGGALGSAVLPCSDVVRKRLAAASIAALIIGVATGGLSVSLVLAGGWPQYVEAASRFPIKAYAMFFGELLFSGVLLVVYYLLWQRLSARRILHALIAVVAATNLLYHFPTMMIVLRLLAEAPDIASPEVIDRSAFKHTLWAPLPIALTAHFWSLSALATGVFVRHACADQDTQGRGDSRVGAGVALLGILGLFLSGVGSLLSLPPVEVRGLFAADRLSGWLFGGGLAAAVWMIARLASAVATDRLALKPLWRDGLVHAGLAAVLLMAAASRLV